ncbi:hypothetical protein L3049_07965 [Labilibaculum sp. DW002]|uniref:Uncharacterized protein n=1 Tax=Paralabilibaculum antarcticum TaxID=2912572 RepID=A0ABT5VR87_9BACT|nr:hypothetical protein [Labilibaculum sp. DW002]MDE5417941.1 hypothetical protein [Labilibaculum sp. DW002]
MKTKKKILFGVVVVIMGFNLLLQGNKNQPNVKLENISTMAMATGEEDPDEVDPTILPTGFIDWLGEIVGF